jgi:hypothetical protein
MEGVATGVKGEWQLLENALSTLQWKMLKPVNVYMIESASQ